MFTRTAVILIAGAGLVVGAFGCQGTNTTSTMVPQSNVDTIHRITNQGLSEKVHFVAANLDTDGPAHLAQVTVQNKSNDPKTFSYLFEWFGSNQIVLGQGEQTWRTVTIQPGQTMALTSVAPARGAIDFRLTVRP